MDNHQALEQAAASARFFLASLDRRPVWPRASYPEMLSALGGSLPEDPSPAEDVVRDLAALADPGLVAIPGGRFFGFVIGGSHPAALAADWLSAAWDQNAGLAALSPAAAAAETVAAGWLLDLLQLPPSATVGFVTGGMMANFSCLAAARHAVLGRAGWDVEKQGLSRAPRVRMVVGADRHGTVDLAVRYLGLGTDSVRAVTADSQGRIDVAGLTEELRRETGPVIVCLQAGEVHTGAFDPFVDAIAASHRHGAWVHVDGAFGLWAAAAPSTRHLLAGVEAADSWATDAHKTLNVPYDSGLAIVSDPAAHRGAFGARADYLVSNDYDPSDLVPELSRRARGFPVWAALRSLGRTGVADLVAGLCQRARQMADGLAGVPGAELLNDVVYTQVLVAFGDDDTTREVGRRLLADGTAVLTPATWRGRAAQRCSISNWSTTPHDIDATLAALRRIVGEVNTAGGAR